jgi:hypothetical protein
MPLSATSGASSKKPVDEGGCDPNEAETRSENHIQRSHAAGSAVTKKCLRYLYLLLPWYVVPFGAPEQCMHSIESSRIVQK